MEVNVPAHIRVICLRVGKAQWSNSVIPNWLVGVFPFYFSFSFFFDVHGMRSGHVINGSHCFSTILHTRDKRIISDVMETLWNFSSCIIKCSLSAGLGALAGSCSNLYNTDSDVMVEATSTPASIFSCVCVYSHTSMCVSMHMEVRGQLCSHGCHSWMLPTLFL